MQIQSNITFMKKTKNKQVAEIVWTISQLSKSIDQHPWMF